MVILKKREEGGIRYILFSENYSCDEIPHEGYGISAENSCSERAVVRDITSLKRKGEALFDIITAGMVSPLHIADVVSDLIS